MVMKNNYRINVYPITTEDGGISWEAVFPDFSHIVGGGDTPEEALREAYENLDVYFEYMGETNLPQTTNPYTEKYSGKFLLRLSKRLHRDLALQAEKEGLSLNAFCSEALARYMGEKNVVATSLQVPTFNQTYCQINIISTGGFRRQQ